MNKKYICRVCKKELDEDKLFPSSIKYGNWICKKCQFVPHKERDKFKKIKDDYGLGSGTIQRYGFRLALKIYEKFDRKCSNCGEENDLTIHHLDNNGRNKLEMGQEQNNSEDNLVIICRRCHGSLHAREYWDNKNKGG